MKKIWETGIILFSVMGFWGMIYPDLCFTEDVCEAVWEDEENNEGGSQAAGADGFAQSGKKGAIGAKEKDMFTRLCEAEPGQIRLKSKFFKMLKSESEGNSDGVDKE